ncbi:ribonuclease hi [Plakobranchus ocellatus]|uniref:Ribonuclease hi n=1 Tax=Plakobranchus ocellatus TaxID=259542 RepID=A0AAV4BY75_9GAST|nr:ribonuclease hi [Plakobranchus ocellatus]
MVKDIRCLYNLIRKFPPCVNISFIWISAYIDIRGNKNVDKLEKAALNRVSSSGKLNRWSDLKPKVNANIHTIWQKIGIAGRGAGKQDSRHEVFPKLGEDLSKRGEGAGRKRETVMCRLRGGHTRLTQCYLLKKMRNRLFAMPATAFTLSGIFLLNAQTFKSPGGNTSG